MRELLRTVVIALSRLVADVVEMKACMNVSRWLDVVLVVRTNLVTVAVSWLRHDVWRVGVVQTLTVSPNRCSMFRMILTLALRGTLVTVRVRQLLAEVLVLWATL